MRPPVVVSADAKPRTAELLTFVYDLGGGNKITGRYENATGQVRVVQRTEELAKVTFRIQR